jgi:hypothetical protein
MRQTEVKTLRQVCAATILSLIFAVSVFAGDVHSPGVAAAAPSVAGDVHCPGVVSTGTATTVSTEIILTAVSLTY